MKLSLTINIDITPEEVAKLDLYEARKTAARELVAALREKESYDPFKDYNETYNRLRKEYEEFEKEESFEEESFEEESSKEEKGFSRDEAIEELSKIYDDLKTRNFKAQFPNGFIATVAKMAGNKETFIKRCLFFVESGDTHLIMNYKKFMMNK